VAVNIIIALVNLLFNTDNLAKILINSKDIFLQF